MCKAQFMTWGTASKSNGDVYQSFPLVNFDFAPLAPDLKKVMSFWGLQLLSRNTTKETVPFFG
jgi:hypothetical protein